MFNGPLLKLHFGIQGQDNKFQQLDVDPRSDDDASLMSSERFMLRHTRTIKSF